MEYKDYMNRIQQRLKEMSEEEKNCWIYHYARVYKAIRMTLQRLYFVTIWIFARIRFDLVAPTNVKFFVM